MGAVNLLVEGLSGAGETSVADELARRGEHVVHGDRVLAYQGDPVTGERTATQDHEHHVWDEEAVRCIAADRSAARTWFCGGARNSAAFLEVFDGVFVLVADAATLERRLSARPAGEFGHRPAERDLVRRLHAAGSGVPTGRDVVRVDATAPLPQVVDALLVAAGASERRTGH